MKKDETLTFYLEPLNNYTNEKITSGIKESGNSADNACNTYKDGSNGPHTVIECSYRIASNLKRSQENDSGLLFRTWILRNEILRDGSYLIKKKPIVRKRNIRKMIRKEKV